MHSLGKAHFGTFLRILMIAQLISISGCSLPFGGFTSIWGNPAEAAEGEPKGNSSMGSSQVGPKQPTLYTKMMSQGEFSEAAILQSLQSILRPDSKPTAIFARLDLPLNDNPQPARISFSNGKVYSAPSLDANLHSDVGWSLVLDGNYAGAEAAYREAVRHKSDFAGAYLGLGMALMMQGNREGAISAYESALAIQPGYSAALVHLGYAYTDGQGEKEDYQKARSLFRKALHQGDPFAKLALLDLNTRVSATGKGKA